jgi:hypothetical protein
LDEDNPLRDWHAIAVELLLADADLALLSVSWIFSYDDRDAIAHLVHNTRNVYDSIVAKRKELNVCGEDAEALDEKMERLRARLRVLGEAV